ncbi:MAG: hypothetical protein PHU06_11220 [Gallionella sp.]|nr:hypothetical protein [Gallionella sp.]MDD4959846.1 hypothetical protein [Gallionella sp.]
MSEQFVVSSVQHRAFGKLIQVIFSEKFLLRLTMAEASSLSFALVAVRNGISPEHEIFMSPIASDMAFIGAVGKDGIRIAQPEGELDFTWANVEALAAALAAAIG